MATKKSQYELKQIKRILDEAKEKLTYKKS